MNERIGDWFQTHTGVMFYPLDPRPEEVIIEDIAHALARVCRFGGHVRDFYSVAQHSVLVSEVVEQMVRDMPWSHSFTSDDARVITLGALLHDAAEAYVGDMVRPLKLAMPEYREIERRLEVVIAAKFGVRFPWHPGIKEADNRLLATERRDVLAVEREWTFRAEPLVGRIVPMSPARAERAFLRRFKAIPKLKFSRR